MLNVLITIIQRYIYSYSIGPSYAWLARLENVIQITSFEKIVGAELSGYSDYYKVKRH